MRQEFYDESPQKSAFSQQKLEAWRPILSTTNVLIICLSIGFFSLIIGIILFVSTNNLHEEIHRYDNITDNYINIELKNKMKGNLVIFYKLTNFYQNHKRYIDSRSYPQLAGKYVDYEGMKSDCGYFYSYNYDETDPYDWIVPCGSIAYSVFNDTFEIQQNGETVDCSSDQISWKSDQGKMFKQVNSKYSSSWINTTIFERGQRDDHFIVWMRASTLPTFIKPYAICKNSDFQEGDIITINIENNYDVSSFNGEKWILISEMSIVGGKNISYAIGYFVLSGSLILSSILVVLTHFLSSRKYGEVPDDLRFEYIETAYGGY